jgi:hypothetical protein
VDFSHVLEYQSGFSARGGKKEVVESIPIRMQMGPKST